MANEPERKLPVQSYEEKFAALYMESMQHETVLLAYAQMLKMMIETHQRPPDEKIIQILETMIVSVQRYKNYRESFREERTPDE